MSFTGISIPELDSMLNNNRVINVNIFFFYSSGKTVLFVFMLGGF